MNPVGHAQGYVDLNGVLRLPNPEEQALGGRVFGANMTGPDAVNDFAESGDQLAARVGFMVLGIEQLVAAKGEVIHHAYFHSFEMNQDAVGADPAGHDGSFSRGPAIAVDALSGLPAIEVLTHDAGMGSRAAACLSQLSPSRTVFMVTFDKEVVPNSVGCSRRHTAHSKSFASNVVFSFAGNTAPKSSANAAYTSPFDPIAPASPIASSISLALNQPTQVAVNNPFERDANGDGLLDDGVTTIAQATGGLATPNDVNGLYPPLANMVASLPRAVVPLEVCLPGLGSTGTYHGYIANAGGDNVLISESGPSGVAGIGFDDIIGAASLNTIRAASFCAADSAHEGRLRSGRSPRCFRRNGGLLRLPSGWQWRGHGEPRCLHQRPEPRSANGRHHHDCSILRRQDLCCDATVQLGAARDRVGGGSS
ncbi:MAG: hypothetical protein ACI9EF_001812 [Pseudohongiellaceae bacterium]|jgi:hypothetical protein